MGTSVSKLEKALADVPESERYYGFENYSSTCYCNSVLQALLFCVPFREQVVDYCTEIKNSADAEDNLLTCLADLFIQISSQKRKTGTISPKRFIDRVKKDNEVFRTYMHQDAHEFLNFLLNGLAEILEKEVNGAHSSPETFSVVEKIGNGSSNSPDNGVEKEQAATFIHKIFQGVLTNETRCLRCETVTARDETFLDLSIDIQENSSITSCLKKFSSMETLNAEDKFFCDECSSLQEAQRSMKIKKAPQILVIHLKRFKYFDNIGRHSKLFYRVAYPLELKINSTMDDPDTEYHLFAVVVHMGRGANQGHYISLVKSYNHWLSFDDETVDESDESAVQSYFGTPENTLDKADHGYILFYERVEKRSE